MLNKRPGPATPEVESRIHGLSVEQHEDLAEALLDFTGPFDLEAWFDALDRGP